MKITSCKNTVLNLGVIGGGPIGLYLANELKKKGNKVTVFEKQEFPRDKVCGQGILPRGLKLRAKFTPFCAGIDRISLSKALYEETLKKDILVVKETISKIQNKSNGILLNDKYAFDLIFACDGHNSTIRRLTKNSTKILFKNRLGARVHINQKPWSDKVEVYWSYKIEAYVTPISEKKIEIAFLWFQDKNIKGRDILDQLISSFPKLKEKIDVNAICDDFKCIGPFTNKSKRIFTDKVFFVGDSYYFADGITGTGISTGLKAAQIIAENFKDLNFKSKLKIHFLYLNHKIWILFSRLISVYPNIRKWVFKLARSTNILSFLIKINDS